MREIRKLESALRGWPDDMLTMGLVITAGVLLLVAWRGPTLLKAAALSWALFP